MAAATHSLAGHPGWVRYVTLYSPPSWERSKALRVVIDVVKLRRYDRNRELSKAFGTLREPDADIAN